MRALFDLLFKLLYLKAMDWCALREGQEFHQDEIEL
jgi:hypothetical protein